MIRYVIYILLLASCAPYKPTTDTPPLNHKRLRVHISFTEDCKDNTQWEMTQALTTPSGYACALWRYNPYTGLFEVGVETEEYVEISCPMVVGYETWWVDIYDDQTNWWIHLSDGKEYRFPKKVDINDYTVEFCHSKNYNYLYCYDRY